MTKILTKIRTNYKIKIIILKNIILIINNKNNFITIIIKEKSHKKIFITIISNKKKSFGKEWNLNQKTDINTPIYIKTILINLI